MSKAPAKQTYIVRRDGWVDGRPRKAGDEVQLTEGQARYEQVDLKAAKSRKPAEKADT